jgi:SAM-dependent methyltransferase
MLLKPDQRTKLDDSDDTLFYDYPRFVTHVDDAFIKTLTQLYRDRLQSNTRILDLMSSWVSHLPEETAFAHIEGHGMNEEELAKNPRLDRYFVQNLNQDSQLPLPDESFDAVLNTASVQYLQYPEAVFSEIHRILKPGGIAIFSFSNRMFFQKAIQLWRDSSEAQRVKIVERYFKSSPGFETPEIVQSTSSRFPFWGSDPFYAVLAYKQPRSSKSDSR